MRNRIVLIVASASIAVTASNAADMYSAPAGVSGVKDEPAYAAVDWSGFYVGIDGGYGRVEENGAAGGFFGGQIGYNLQRGNILLGVEADIQDSHISKGEGRLDYFGTVRGRAGYVFGSAVVYATGGFAYGKVSCVDPDCSFVHGGYTVGGGLEYKLTRSWSLKAEYQYTDLTEFPGFPDGHLRMDIVRAGMNYHFDSGYLPLK